jgi:hypothetical protein
MGGFDKDEWAITAERAGIVDLRSRTPATRWAQAVPSPATSSLLPSIADRRMEVRLLSRTAARMRAAAAARRLK